MLETYIKNCFRIIHNLLDAPISDPNSSDELFLKNVLSRLNKIESHQQMLRQCEQALLDELAVNRMNLDHVLPMVNRPELVADALLSLYDSRDLMSVLKKLEWINVVMAGTALEYRNQDRLLRQQLDLQIINQLKWVILVGILGFIMTNYTHHEIDKGHVDDWLLACNFTLFMMFMAGISLAGWSYSSRSTLDKETNQLKKVHQTYAVIEEDILQSFSMDLQGKTMRLNKPNQKALRDDLPPKFVFFPTPVIKDNRDTDVRELDCVDGFQPIV